jgi:hypothetical protein
MELAKAVETGAVKKIFRSREDSEAEPRIQKQVPEAQMVVAIPLAQLIL